MIAAGNYYLLYKADANGNVGESNETNNIVNKAIAINGPKPDLVIQNPSAPASATIGTTITLSYQIKNQGNDNAGVRNTYFELRSVNAQIEYLLTEAGRKTGRWKEDKRQKNTKKHKMDTQTQDTLDD